MFNNREEVLQFAKTGLNQIRGFVKVFKPKIKRKQKRKEKENRKRVKGHGDRIRPATEGSPRPISPSLPNPYASLFFSPANTWVPQWRHCLRHPFFPKFRRGSTEAEKISRDQLDISVPISSPPRTYITPPPPALVSLRTLAEIAARLRTPEVATPPILPESAAGFW
jgi:hypothetical protein